MAVTRQTPGLFESTAADSIVVFGSATLARLSHDRTAFAFAMAGFGVGLHQWRQCRRSAATAAEPARHHVRLAGPAPCPIATSSIAADAATNVRFTRFMVILARLLSGLIHAHDSRNGAGPAGG